MDGAPEDQAPRAHRQAPGDRAGPPEPLGLAPALHLALGGRPEEVEDLGEDEHRRHPVLADGLEHDARVPAPDVEDVGPEVEGEAELDRHGVQVRHRQERDEPVLDVGDDEVERVDSRHRVAVGQHDALRGAGRAGGVDEQVDVVAAPGDPTTRPAPPSRRASPAPGSAQRSAVVTAGRWSRSASAGSGASRPVPITSWQRPGAVGDAPDRVGGHVQVERHEDEPGPHRPEVDGGELGAGRRPRQEAIARPEPARPEPPRGEPAPPVQLAVAPRRDRAVLVAEPDRGLVAVARDGALEEVDQGATGRSIGAHGPIVDLPGGRRNGPAARGVR